MEKFDFKNYKLVAVDMDGTFLGSDLKIPEKHREAVRICNEKGVAFAICTGRAFVSVAPYTEVLGDNDFVVGYNGAGISKRRGSEIIFRKTLDYNAAMEVFRLSEEDLSV